MAGGVADGADVAGVAVRSLHHRRVHGGGGGRTPGRRTADRE